MLAEAERERREGRAAGPAEGAQGWMARTKARTMRWVAESIAEQRLLWHLRGQTDACLFYPDDVDGGQRDRRAPIAAAARLRQASLLADHRRPRVRRAPACSCSCPDRTPRLLLRVPSGRPLLLDARRPAGSLGGDVAHRAQPPARELRRAIALEPAAREHACTSRGTRSGSSISPASSSVPRCRRLR